jgi:hypothetical protein
MTGTWEQVWHWSQSSKHKGKVQSKAPTSLFSMSSRLSVGFGNQKFFCLIHMVLSQPTNQPELPPEPASQSLRTLLVLNYYTESDFAIGR